MTVLPMKELGMFNSHASECHFAVLILSLQMQNKSSSRFNPNFNFLNAENTVTSEVTSVTSEVKSAQQRRGWDYFLLAGLKC